MSTVLCDLVQLNAVQARLDQLYIDGSKHLMGQKTPLLNYVMSQENKSAFDLEREMSRDGKIRGVQIRFKQAKLPSEVQEDITGCDATGQVCQVWQDYDFDPDHNFGLTLKLGVGELKDNPDENTATIAEEVRLMIQAIKERYHQDLCEYVAANLGGWSSDTGDIDGVAVAAGLLKVNTTLPSDSNALRIANPVLFEQLAMAFDINEYGSLGIFGAAELASYVRRAQFGSDSATGYNLRAALDQFGIGATYDRVLAAELASAGNATNVAVGIGAIAPVGWSLYDSQGAKIQQTDSIADTIFDPETGMKFEFRMTRPCDDWEIQVRARYQWFNLPDNRYKTGHPLDGVNNIGGIQVTCDNLQSCIA